MTRETASQLLGLMDGLCETEQGRLAVAVLRYIATGEKKEPRGTERALFGQAIGMIYTDDVQGAQDLHNIYKNNISKDLLSQPAVRRSSDTLFDTFWEAYPVKVNKKRCVEIWKKIKPDEALVRKMLESIEAWKQSKKWKSGYINDPDTWLRNEKWNDEMPQPERKQHFALERDGISEKDFNALVVNLTEE